MNKLSLLTFRYMKVNMKRTVTTCIGVIVSTILIYLIFSVGYSIYYSDAEEFYKYAYYEIDGVIVCDGASAKEIVESADYYGGNANKADVKLSGAWAISFNNEYNGVYINDFFAMGRQLNLRQGTFPKNDNSVLVPDWYARFEEASVGDAINFGYGADDKKYISGIYNDDNYLAFDDSTLSERFGDAIFIKSPDKVFESEKVYVFVTLKNGKDIQKQIRHLSETYNAQKFEVIEAARSYREPKTDVSYAAYTAFLMLIAFVGITISIMIIRNAFNISVHTRSNDYGILRCIGMSRKQIIRIIFYEALIISLIGLIFGIIIGHGLSILIFSIFKRILSLSKYYRIRLIPRALGLAVLSVFVATFYSMISPVEKLYKLNPIRALKMSDEYENKDKKLKGKRGRLLTKLFGVETGYAYKNILRNKKRFLLLVTTLTVWTVLASAIFTIISTAKKALYDELAPNCDYAGFVEIYNRESADSFIASLKELDEVKKVTYMETVFLSDKQNQNLRYLGYGFSREEFLNFAAAADGYDEDKNGTNGVLLYSNTKLEAGNVFYGNTKVLGVFNDEEKLINELRKYEPWEVSILSLNNIIIYDINNKGFINFVENNGGGNGVLIEFKDNLKHPEFDKFISETNYSFDDYFYEYKTMVDGLTVVKTGIIGFLILVFILYMINTINTNSSEMMLRKKEFNILRTIGMSKKQVDKMLYLEGLLVSVIAAFIGNLLGSFLGNAVFNLFMLAGKEPEEMADPIIHIDFPAIILITVLLIIINVFAIWVTKPEDEDIIFD